MIILLLLTLSFGVIYGQQTYTPKAVKIGNQIWMSENLNVDCFRNGEIIPEAKTEEEWELAGIEGRPAWCFYITNTNNVKNFGKLYNWYAVTDPRNLAPVGWHIPTDKEWAQLIFFLGGAEVAGTKMKSINGWDENGNGNNVSGFNGLPGGTCNTSGMFLNSGVDGIWWSSTEYNSSYVWGRVINCSSGYVYRINILSKQSGCSIRCIKD